VLGCAALPRSEPRGERLEPLAGPLVGVRDDPFLARGEGCPAPVSRLVGQARHGVVVDGALELGVAALAQPGGAGRAVAEVYESVIAGQQLVDVMEEGRGLDERPLDLDAASGDPRGEERGDLGHGAHVTDEPRRWPQVDQDARGLDA
jgi:hypothetical protein